MANQRLFACAAALALSLAMSSQAARADDRKPLTCNDLNAFHPDSLTTVLLVKEFKKGEVLRLAATPATPPPPVAANDVCMVKLLVGPGNPGPAGAPSTSPGIGIEVWLPTAKNWNRRIHVAGGGGWAGGNQTRTDLL